MNRRYDTADEKNFARDLLIGLGESSVRKSYYPELQERMLELERFRLLLDQTPEVIFLVNDSTKKIVDGNATARNCNELMASGLIGREISDYLEMSIIPEKGEMSECFLKYKEGQRLPVEVSTHRVSIQEEKFLVIVARDISERKQAEKKLIEAHAALHTNFKELEKAQRSLIESENRYRYVVEVSSDAIWDWDIVQDIWSISKQWAKKLGLLPINKSDSNSQVSNDNNTQVIIEDLMNIWNARIYSDDFVQRKHVLDDHLAGKSEIYEVEYRFLIPPERWMWLSVKGKVMFDDHGKPTRMLGSYSDITTRKYQEGRIRHMAYHDALTDLPNRASLYEEVAILLVRTKQMRRKEEYF